MSQLTTKEANLLINRTQFETLDHLTATLSTAPKQTKRNKFAANAEYVPISQIEADLDDIYGPNCWQVSEPSFTPLGQKTWTETKTDANGNLVEVLKIRSAILCTVELQVLHPIFNTWIVRGGTASGEFSEKQVTTFSGKLKAEALKNAAKSLGAVFGRDLNRDTKATEANETVEGWLEDEGIIDMIANAQTVEDLKIIQSQWTTKVQRHPAVKKALNKRALEIRTTK